MCLYLSVYAIVGFFLFCIKECKFVCVCEGLKMKDSPGEPGAPQWVEINQKHAWSQFAFCLPGKASTDYILMWDIIATLYCVLVCK